MILIFLTQGAIAQIKIATVGNSITYGYGVVNRNKNAYPAQLQAILGEKYEVKNFGISGRTLLKKGDYPYWSTEEYQKALKYQPDIVIIKLGTNDSKLINRKHLKEFESDYLNLIESFKNLESNPRIILCLPVPAFTSDTIGITSNVIEQQIIPLTREVAYKSESELVNLYNLFLDKKGLLPDMIHPNSLGATLISNRLYKQITQETELDFDLISTLKIDGGKTNFFGFEQLTFEWKGVQSRIVKPKQTAIGRPWVLRARFWGHEPQTDIALLERGFHIVYTDVANLYGSPKAVKRWNEFYALMRKGGLSEKVVLEGMSRGGLIMYNWAIQNLKKVACIYADAPVLDGKSWPGGKGKGKYSEIDWKQLKLAFGFESEKAALYFKGFPINHAKQLAKSKIPLLHVCGESDQVVPVNENTRLFEETILKYGGNIKTIYKQGIGHHPHSLKNPTQIVDFILRATGYKINMAAIPTPGAEFRSAAGWKQGADWWANHEDIKTQLSKTKNNLDLLFIGNSITQSLGGNREAVTYKPGKNAFDEVLKGYSWETAGISGDRTQHVLWRILNGNYNLAEPKVVVLTIGVNNFSDDESAEVTVGITEIISALKTHLPDSKILLLGPLPTGTKSDHIYRVKYEKVHKSLSKLSKKWKVKYLDLGKALISSNGNLNPEYYSADGIHLGSAGYRKWAEMLLPVINRIMN